MVRFVGEVSDAAYDQYLAELLLVLQKRAARARKCVLLNDATAGFRGSSEQHQRESTWKRSHADLFNKRLAAIGYVVADPFTRSVLTSVLKLNPGPVPFQVHGSLVTATAWAKRLVSLSV